MRKLSFIKEFTSDGLQDEKKIKGLSGTDYYRTKTRSVRIADIEFNTFSKISSI